jgi:hypothetical protein
MLFYLGFFGSRLTLDLGWLRRFNGNRKSYIPRALYSESVLERQCGSNDEELTLDFEASGGVGKTAGPSEGVIVSEHTIISEDALVSGHANVSGVPFKSGDTILYGDALLTGDTAPSGSELEALSGKSIVRNRKSKDNNNDDSNSNGSQK